jgi:hypothetical protein
MSYKCLIAPPIGIDASMEERTLSTKPTDRRSWLVSKLSPNDQLARPRDSFAYTPRTYLPSTPSYFMINGACPARIKEL